MITTYDEFIIGILNVHYTPLLNVVSLENVHV